jgi:hypothetical protein
MIMANHIICSNMLMFRTSVIRSKHMTGEYDNNNEEYSSEAIHNKSRISSQNKDLLKVLEALESQEFKLFDYHEN